MSEPRKSAIQTEARRRARERAAEFRAREEQLEALAVDYFLATAASDAIGVELELSIASLRERAQKESEQARSSAENAVQSMLSLGVSRSEVASRLGVPTRLIRRPSAAGEQSEAGGEDDREFGEPEGPHHE